MRSRIQVLVLCGLLLSACGPTGVSPSPTVSELPTPSVIPVQANSEFAVGANRAIIAFIDPDTNGPVVNPDRTVAVRFEGPGGASVQASTPEFVWAIQDERGVYVTHVDFPTAGDWRAVITTAAPGAPTEEIPLLISVKDDGSAVRIGEPAPSVDTPTADDVDGDLTLLSTDEDPLARMYETSVADALAAGEPFVLAFATPKFCVSDQCGPTLDRLKAIAAKHPDLTFINVEPYVLAADAGGQLQPVTTGEPPSLQPVEAVNAFGLLAEPYVYVVGADGKVVGAFELIFGDEEIEAAIAELG
jgi:hypothetical protein